MIKISPTLSASQLMTRLARNVRLGNSALCPKPIDEMDDEGLILLLGSKPTVYPEFIEFINVENNTTVDPQTGEPISVFGKKVTLNGTEYHIVYQCTIKEFIEEADLHFLISSLRNAKAQNPTT